MVRSVVLLESENKISVSVDAGKKALVIQVWDSDSLSRCKFENQLWPRMRWS